MGFGPILLTVLVDRIFGLLIMGAFYISISGIVGGCLASPFVTSAYLGFDWRTSSPSRKATSLVIWSIVSLTFFGSVGVLAAYLALLFHPPYC